MSYNVIAILETRLTDLPKGLHRFKLSLPHGRRKSVKDEKGETADNTNTDGKAELTDTSERSEGDAI